MKILSRVIDRVKSVYQYEKTTRIDAGAIQNVMIIFVIVMLLINIQNFRLGEYFVTALTLVVSGISIFAILALGYSDKIYVICMASVVIFLILSIPISLLGPNRGFALLWYFLMPIVSIVLLGMPFGIPEALVYILRLCFIHHLKACLYMIILSIIFFIIRYFTGLSV